MTKYNMIWKEPTTEQLNWVNKFKNIFILQQKNKLTEIFSEDFDYHNGFTREQYSEYEFEEFALKCESFGLLLSCSIQCYQLDNDFIYFSLGKKDDKALFEAIFKWDNTEKKVKGNGYRFKIEPKIQFIKNNSNISLKRRINLTPNQNTKIKTLLINADNDNFHFIKNELQPHLGGNFYSAIYEYENENQLSFWDNLTIYSTQGVFQSQVLMRGKDHPLFIDNLFPEVKKYSVTCAKGIYPVVLYILLEDGEELFYKYPTQSEWHFHKKIKKVCLTDPLSFDWIVEN